jgi:hypothetical protein
MIQSHRSINREAELKLSHEILLLILDYNPDTGVFIWKVDYNPRAMKGSIAGSPHPKLGHIGIQINKRRYLAHRLAWFYVHKEWPSNIIDHRDRNPQNNKIANLRDVDQSTNMLNANLRQDNSSGTPGVGYVSSKGMWRARIMINQKEKHLGMFLSKDDAIAARRRAEEYYK